MDYVIIGILIAVIVNAGLIRNLYTMQYKQLESIRKLLDDQYTYSREVDILEELKQIQFNTSR